jgi:phosphonate transport system permease protein
MIRLRPAPPLLCLLPALALIPVLVVVLPAIHSGGLQIWLDCLLGALQPSLDPVVLQAMVRALQVTLATALAAWGLSGLSGALLALLSADVFWLSRGAPLWPAQILRNALALPRSIHELIWGLLLLQIFGLHPWVAVLAIAIPYSALVARVWRDQLDSLDRSSLIAQLQTGAQADAAMITTLAPAMTPSLLSYGGYRLECALRSATLLGVFGLGGLGTELQLSLQSLRFHEFWSGLWLLIVCSVALEQGLRFWRTRPKERFGAAERRQLLLLGLLLISAVVGGLWMQQLFPDDGAALAWQWPPLPDRDQLLQASTELAWGSLIVDTLRLTLLAAGLAIGLPALVELLWNRGAAPQVQSLIWSALRLLPPPLTLLMLLLANQPSLALAALALGLQNAGVLGRLLREGLDQQDQRRHQAMTVAGADSASSWLYGQLAPQSRAYLAYGAYRADVILRETIVVGLVGGTGLGWALIESLSSFHWAAVWLLIGAFSLLTLTGEALSDRQRQRWLQS